MKTVRPILNITCPPFISKLAGLALTSQPVKIKIIQWWFEWLNWNFTCYSGIYISMKFHDKIFKTEKFIKKIQKMRVFFTRPLIYQHTKYGGPCHHGLVNKVPSLGMLGSQVLKGKFLNTFTFFIHGAIVLSNMVL